VNQVIRAFAKSVLIGTLAGGVPIAVLTIPMAVINFFQPMTGIRDIWADVYFAALPFLISFPIVLIASTFVGLPVHFLFNKWDRAGPKAYLLTGIGAGFVASLLLLLAIGAEAGFWICGVGAFSGAITALTWSKSMQTKSARGP
jgi:hypothetical protein